jgi:hypothetical protein
MENTTPAVHPTSADAALGPASLIPGEKPCSYDELLARFTEALKPSDIVEEMWVRDVVDLVWEVLRLRRLKANLLSACAHEGMKEVLLSMHAGDEFTASRKWEARDAEAVKRCEKALAAGGFSIDTVMARTFSERMFDMERFERMTTAAELRRNTALQQIERHRAGFGSKLRRSTAEALAAEFRRLAPQLAPAVGPA